jgi:serine phosphatase RsbU (regulator of sigma subunit)
VAIFLIDYDQSHLVPLGSDQRTSGAEARSISVDGAAAGRAFRDTEVVPCEDDGGYWIPLLDGVERLGVLRWVQLPDRLGDGEFDIDEARQVSYLLAHLLASNSQYCDSLHLARLPKPRTPESELVWSMLPPLTVTAPGVVVSGALAPSHQAAGDVFDYAIDGGIAQFAIADATGHDTQASLIAALAVAAYRNARRRSLDLPATVDHVEAALQNIGPLTLLTGVFSLLDLHTGDLRYVIAGHPHPLLIRHGRVIGELDGGRRPLLGIPSPTQIGHLALEPGDCILLYTDGITEARDTRRQQFGVARLVSIVERCAAHHNSAPETLRLITSAVLEHQNGVLQDDATMVLVQWQPSADQVLAVKDPLPPNAA